jgi:anti-sigma28 factor (negative regulator of flagellin synthesis)
MSSVNPVGGGSPVHKIVSQPVHRQVSAGNSPAQGDKVELSGVNNFLKLLKANDVRMEKVTAIKSQIESRTYETDDKIELAADRLLDDVLR